jgi:hypothetical protein
MVRAGEQSIPPSALTADAADALATGARLARPIAAGNMSRQAIEVVVHRLLTEEGLRRRFVVDRIETLGELQAEGIELTPGELDLFIESDARVWLSLDGRIALLIH